MIEYAEDGIGLDGVFASQVIKERLSFEQAVWSIFPPGTVKFDMTPGNNENYDDSTLQQMWQLWKIRAGI